MKDVKSFQSISKLIPGEPWGYKSPVRLVVKYGLHQLGEQTPYFSITADLIKPGRGCVEDYDFGGGCMHELIAKKFPGLKDLIPWHLVNQAGLPMHYVANSLYHLKQGELEHFKGSSLYGVLPTDAAFTPSIELPASVAEKWLEGRKGALAAAFVAAMKRFGCKPIVNGAPGEWS